MLTGILMAIVVGLFSWNGYLDHQQLKPFQATKKEQQQLKFYQQSEQWFLDHLKHPQIEIDGQRLHPKFQYMMEEVGDTTNIQKFLQTLFKTSLGRKYIRNMGDRNWILYSKITQDMQKIQDLTVTGRDGKTQIPIRIYIPDIKQSEPLPVMIYAHGGGYLFGSIKALERPVQMIANEAKVIVISIDYRLAPEYPYPAASDDGEDVFLWTKQHVKQFGGDSQRIAFGGDSAGGHIAVNVAQRQLLAGNEPPEALLLYYPAVGNPMADHSYKLFGKGYGLDASFFEYLLTQVFPDKTLQDTPDQFMSPLQSSDLTGMPPTILATAGFDILRDSGRAFAERLQQDNVDITYINYPSLTHSFLQFSGVVGDAEQATVETARLLGQKIREN